MKPNSKHVCKHSYQAVLHCSNFSSTSDYVAIVDLPEGEHQYKFLIDGEWKHNPSEVTFKNNETIMIFCKEHHIKLCFM